MSETVLYGYWRSSATYRVRIALNAAGVRYRPVEIDLLAGEHRDPAFRKRNPQGLVPAVEIDGLFLTQSLAIVEYLDETRGAHFLPSDAPGRARVRAIAEAIAMEIHPVCNPRIANHAVELAGGGDEARSAWMQKFIGEGLAAVEAMLDNPATGRFCHGDAPGIADFCLVPQVYNAERWGADIATLTRIRRICEACTEMPAFKDAHPDAVRPG